MYSLIRLFIAHDVDQRLIEVLFMVLHFMDLVVVAIGLVDGLTVVVATSSILQ